MRISLAHTLRNRSHRTDKDARLLNAYAEEKDGVMRVSKRPSLVATFDAVTVGAGLGLFVRETPDPPGDEELISITGNTVTTNPTPKVTRLAFTTQPVNWKLDTAMSPAVVVAARDSFGATVTSYTRTITIALYANPSGGTLSGTLSVAAVAGVATFSNLKINTVGGGYSLRATASGLLAATSSTFKIISNLSFTVQPGTSRAGETFDTPPEVSIVDSAGTTITGYVGNVTVAIGTNGGSPAGTLSGTLTVAAVNGVASFTNLEIDNAGTYTLVASASAGGLINVTSNSFSVVNATHILNAFDFGAGVFGFDANGLGTGGSITPATLTGATILQFFSETLNDTTQIRLSRTPVPPSTFFTSVKVGSITFLAADANYSTIGNEALWEWQVGTLVPSAGEHSVTFV